MTQSARRYSPPDRVIRNDETLGPSGASIGVGGASLAEALLSGDEAAFTALVERETSNVFQVCYRVLGDVTEAEEATQDAFVLAYRGLATYRAEGPPQAWLARIAVREAWRRGKARKQERLERRSLDEFGVSAIHDSIDVEREVIAHEDREAVRAAVAKLHSPYQEVILDRYFANLSLREIAEVTGRPLGTVKVQIHRGLAYMRQWMEEAAP